tara:strand:+ start:1063 stop:1581 length:519 start_codon:yes stop_codon:yes gene_type:complete
MEETTYTLSINDSEGTANVNYLLSGRDGRGVGDADLSLRGLNPGSFEQVFGPGDDLCYDPEGGYQDPEWYWKSSDGCVWGIGWRWGQPRLRGKGKLSAEKANHFVDFLFNSLHDRILTQDLESAVVQLILDEAQGTEFDLSDARIRKAIVNALGEAAKTFDRTDEEWRDMME